MARYFKSVLILSHCPSGSGRRWVSRLGIGQFMVLPYILHADSAARMFFFSVALALGGLALKAVLINEDKLLRDAKATLELCINMFRSEKRTPV